MNITDSVQSKASWWKFIQHERASAKILPLGRSGSGFCQHSLDKQLNCIRFLPLYEENKLYPSLLLLQGRVSSFHRAISKQGNLLEDGNSGELPLHLQYADLNLLKRSSSGARVPSSAALAPGSLLCPTFWLLAWKSLSRTHRVQEHLGLFSNLPPA